MTDGEEVKERVDLRRNIVARLRVMRTIKQRVCVGALLNRGLEIMRDRIDLAEIDLFESQRVIINVEQRRGGAPARTPKRM